MKITIQIENVTSEALAALANATSTLKISNVNPFGSTMSLTVPTLKKDGTPAKKRGRPVGTTKKVKA